MHRWHNFSRIFEMGYDVAFYLDCDVIFFESPMFHFKKYSEENVMWALYDGDNVICILIYGAIFTSGEESLQARLRSLFGYI